MHIYIGGAHNGKRAFVRAKLEQQDVQWFEGELPAECRNDFVVAGLENWLATTNLSEEESIELVLQRVAGENSVVILTDIGRGIVPMDAQQRQLRDTCGRLYQRLMTEANEVTRIWYGLPKTLKKRGENI